MMKEITDVEMDNLKVIRLELHGGYFYSLVKFDEDNYATIGGYVGGKRHIQNIGIIDEKNVLELGKLDFINTHAIIHIMPKKHIKKWRNLKLLTK